MEIRIGLVMSVWFAKFQKLQLWVSKKAGTYRCKIRKTYLCVDQDLCAHSFSFGLQPHWKIEHCDMSTIWKHGFVQNYVCFVFCIPENSETPMFYGTDFVTDCLKHNDQVSCRMPGRQCLQCSYSVGQQSESSNIAGQRSTSARPMRISRTTFFIFLLIIPPSDPCGPTLLHNQGDNHVFG